MPAFFAWEQQQKRNPTSALAVKESIRNSEREESAYDRRELSEISGDEQIHQRDKALLSDFRNFDALLERFRQVCKEENNSRIWDSEARRAGTDLSSRLHRAALLFDDASYPAARDRINQVSMEEARPVDEKTKKQFDEWMAKTLESFNVDGNRNTDTLEVLRAALAILANAAGRQGIDPISEAITLCVRAHDSPFGRNMEAMSERFYMDDEGVHHDPFHIAMDDDMRRSWLHEMEGDITQLRKLDAGAQKPEPKKPLHNDHDDDFRDPDAEDYYNTRWDKQKLLKHLMRGAKEHLEDPTDLMRFHNQFPEAINFILASHEGEFLMHQDGRSRQVHNVANFVNSYWMTMAGDAEISVSPDLLAATRTLLKTQPLRALAAASVER
jgi:hypothetical protein